MKLIDQYHSGLSRAKKALFISVLIVILIFIIAKIFPFSDIEKFEFNFAFMALYSFVAVSVLVGIAGIYFVIYKFYLTQRFYLFLSLAWLFNAIYIVFEGIYHGQNLTHISIIFGVSQISTWLFFASYYSLKFDHISVKFYRHLFNLILITFGWFFLIELIFSLILTDTPDECKFATRLIGGIFVSGYVLISLGICLLQKFKRDEYGALPFLFSLTFILYGVLQFLYVLKVFGAFQDIIVLTFIIALILKILNCIFVLNLVKIDFQLFQEKLSSDLAFKKLGVLTAGVVHDIVTPTNVIDEETKRLATRFSNDSRIISSTDMISHQLRRIHGAVDVINVTRLTKDILYFTKLSVNDSIRKSINAVKITKPTRLINFGFKPEKIFYAYADRMRFEQILINILNNAIEAIYPKNGTINIKITGLEKGGEFIKITIRDNGVGISPEIIGLVKKAAFSYGKTKGNKGLGLFMADILVKLHDGDILIESKENEYTEVSVIIPKFIERRLNE